MEYYSAMKTNKLHVTIILKMILTSKVENCQEDKVIV